MAGDLRSLGASYPALAQAGQQLQGCLDLLQVHRQVSTGGVLGAPCSAELPTQRRPAAVSLRTCSCLVPALIPGPRSPGTQSTGSPRRECCHTSPHSPGRAWLCPCLQDSQHTPGG